MRPIDADALIEKCGDWYVEEGTESGFIGTLKNLLATMPTIQPEKTQLSQEDTTSDTISRQAAIDIERNATVDTNPSHFEAHQKFTQFMDDAEVSSFGRWQWANGFNTALTAVGIDLKKLPPAQPEPQWIPVSERLPEDLSEVNVTWVNHNPELYYEFTKDKPFTATAVYYKGKWYWYSATCVDYLGEYGRCDWNKIDEAIEIIAWMPLPEAYKPNKYCPKCGADMRGEQDEL